MAENKNQAKTGEESVDEILAELGQKPSAPAEPHPIEQTRSFGNEVPVDDNFEQFFKKSVAVIPNQQEPEDDGEYESVDDREEKRSHSLFGLFLQRGRKQQSQQEPEPENADTVPVQMEAHEKKQAEAKAAAVQEAVKKAEREADALAAQRQAQELARRQAEEKAARELARKQALEQAAREREERMAAEQAAKEKAEQEAKERAAEELAAQLAAEQAEREKRAAKARRQQQEEQARQRLEQREAHSSSTAQAALAAIEQAESKPEEPTLQPEGVSFVQKEQQALGAGEQETMSVKLDLGGLPQKQAVQEETDEAPAPKHSKIKEALHLFGRARDEEEPQEEEEDELLPSQSKNAARQEIEDPEELKTVLEAEKARCMLRTVLSGIAALLLVYLGAAARGGTLPLLDMIDPQLAPEPFLAANMILLLGAAVLGFGMLRRGAAGILGRASGDTLPMLAMLGALVQLAVFLAKPEWYDPLHATVFAGPAVLLLCLNQAGRLVQAGAACENFELVNAGVEHEAANVCRDQDEVLRLTKGMDETDPVLLLSRPAAKAKGFLRRSFSDNENEPRLQHLSWLLTVCALAAAGVCLVMGGDAAGAVSSSAGLLCLGAPLASALGSSLPMDLCGKGAARVGAVIPGWESAEELTESNVLHVTSDDLFPSGCIHLHGIKTFEKERIDLAILYAASILQFSSNGLKEVFMAILQNDARMLFKTEGITKTAGKGILGWIDNQRVIVGNRAMMAEHGIEIPSMDYENRYTKGQRSPVYLAVAGRLYGMFLLSYATDPTVLSTIEMLRAEGYSLLVSSDDFCITAENIENAYGLNPGEVRLLNNKQKERLAPALAYAEACDACMIHLGSFASAAGGIRAAISARAAASAAALMCTVSVAVSCVFGLVLAATGGLAGLVLPAVVLYQAAWCGLTLAAPAMKKY